MNRPKGVLTIALYFLILAFSAGSKMDGIGFVLAGLYIYLALRLFFLKRDGWWGARILCWINLLLIVVSAASLIISVMRGQIPGQPVLFGTLSFVVGIIFGVQMLILSYLGRPHIAARFQSSNV